MKKSLLLFSLFFFLTSAITWALPTTKPLLEKTEAVSAKAQKKAQKQQEKWQKKKIKLEQKFQKLEKKLSKKGIKTTQGRRNGLWDDDTFRLGALIALGGLLLTILRILPILGGIFGLIGGIMMIAGVGLMIWVLIESR